MEELKQFTHSRYHQEKEKICNRSSEISRTGYAFVTQGLVAVKRYDTRNLLCSDKLNIHNRNFIKKVVLFCNNSVSYNVL